MDVDKVLQALKAARLSFSRGFPWRGAYWPVAADWPVAASSFTPDGMAGWSPSAARKNETSSIGAFYLVSEDGNIVKAPEGFMRGWVIEALVVGGVPQVQVSAHHIVSRGTVDERVRESPEAAIASWLASANELLLPAAAEADPEAVLLIDNDRWLIWLSLPEIIKHVDMAQGVKADGSVAFYYTCEATCLIARRTKS